MLKENRTIQIVPHRRIAEVDDDQTIATEEQPAMSKAFRVFALVAVCLLALALWLNPSAEQHRAKIKEVIAERSPLERALGVGELTAFASKYRSLGVASITTVNEKTVSFGVFGLIFVAE